MPRIVCVVTDTSGGLSDGPCNYACLTLDPESARDLCDRVALARQIGSSPAGRRFYGLCWFDSRCEPLLHSDLKELEGLNDPETGRPYFNDDGFMPDLDHDEGYFVLPDGFRFGFESGGGSEAGGDEEEEERPRLGSDSLYVLDDGVYWEASLKHVAICRGETPRFRPGQLAHWADLVGGPPYRTLDLSQQRELDKRALEAPWTIVKSQPSSTPD